MFVLRSAFWLSAAFIVMAPSAGIDLGSAARSTGDQIVARGTEAVSEHLTPADCRTIECAVGRTLVANALPAAASAPKHAIDRSSVASTLAAPYPPQRPQWAY